MNSPVPPPLPSSPSSCVPVSPVPPSDLPGDCPEPPTPNESELSKTVQQKDSADADMASLDVKDIENSPAPMPPMSSPPPLPPTSPPSPAGSVQDQENEDEVAKTEVYESPEFVPSSEEYRFTAYDPADIARRATARKVSMDLMKENIPVTGQENKQSSLGPNMATQYKRLIGDIKHYTLIDKVGSGTYGEVFKCQHKITKEVVALKKMRHDVEKNGFPITSIREMKILKELKHDNLVELKEIVTTDLPKDKKKPSVYFAFEYMEHDLSGLLTHEKVPKFSKTQIQCYMRQLISGVEFLHRNHVMHRDIKASNLLLNNQGILKIADLGLARFWNQVNAKGGRHTNKVVTLWYRPPELLMGSTTYDYSVDMWSVGCIFAELLLGRALMQGRTELEQLNFIYGLIGVPSEENWPGYNKLPNAASFQPEAKYISSLQDVFKDFPPHVLDLLTKLLTLDPTQRISAIDALDHDYFWITPTCKPRDLPKFPVLSTHEYQNKKRTRDEKIIPHESSKRFSFHDSDHNNKARHAHHSHVHSSGAHSHSHINSNAPSYHSRDRYHDDFHGNWRRERHYDRSRSRSRERYSRHNSYRSRSRSPRR